MFYIDHRIISNVHNVEQWENHRCTKPMWQLLNIYLINAKTILQTPNQPDYAIVFVDKSKTMKMITVSKFIM